MLFPPPEKQHRPFRMPWLPGRRLWPCSQSWLACTWRLRPRSHWSGMPKLPSRSGSTSPSFTSDDWTVKWYLWNELVCLTCRLWTVADAPSRVTRMRTILRRCSKIICVAYHMVGDNKLCAINLVFCLDLNYIMGSQLQRIVFELLELVSPVNLQL